MRSIASTPSAGVPDQKLTASAAELPARCPQLDRESRNGLGVLRESAEQGRLVLAARIEQKAGPGFDHTAQLARSSCSRRSASSPQQSGSNGGRTWWSSVRAMPCNPVLRGYRACHRGDDGQSRWCYSRSTWCDLFASPVRCHYNTPRLYNLPTASRSCASPSPGSCTSRTRLTPCRPIGRRSRPRA